MAISTQKHPILIKNLERPPFEQMSAYALTPETYAAWRHVESENKTDPREHDWEEIARTQEELNLLLAGKRCPLPLPL